MTSIINQIILPAKNYSNYNENSYLKHLIWLPETKELAYKIPCLWFEQPKSNMLIVFAHGNGMDIGSYYFYKNVSKMLDTSMLFWEYPAYGYLAGKSKGEATADNTDLHMNRVMDFVQNDLKWPLSNVILYGHSIGTGPTCTMAAKLCKEKQQLGGVILQSPYTSIKDFVTHVASGMPDFDWNSWKNWNSLENIKDITCPIYIIHGKKDTLIPYNHAEKLFEACKSNLIDNKLISFDEVGHNDFKLPDLIDVLKKFLTEIKVKHHKKDIKLNIRKYRFK
jgi:abhydrolase domain-containing protein 17